MIPFATEQSSNISTHKQSYRKGESDFDLVAAAGYYMEWRSRLQSCIGAHSNDASARLTVDLDSHAQLESWLKGDGLDKYGHLTSFGHLALEHSQFHQLVEVIIAKVREGSPADAEALLKNEFSQSTRRILVAIGDLNETRQADCN